MMRYVPIFGFLVLVALLAWMLVANRAPETGGGKALPALTLTALDGKTAWDQDALKGNVTVFNFFASWCAPCAAEMPELAALRQQFPNVKFEGVAWNDDPKTLNAWLKKHGNPFHGVWLDGKGDATIALGIKGVPETLVVDGGGVIRYRLAGPMTKDLRSKMVAPAIRALMEESHAP